MWSIEQPLEKPGLPEAVLGFVDILAWPAFFLFMVVLFQKQLRSIMDSAANRITRVRFPGGVIEFGKSLEVTEAAARILPTTPPVRSDTGPHATTAANAVAVAPDAQAQLLSTSTLTEFDRRLTLIDRKADADPTRAIHDAWAIAEFGIWLAGERLGLGGSEQRGVDLASILQAGGLHPLLGSLGYNLLAMRNGLAHGGLGEPTPEGARGYVSLVRIFLFSFRQPQGNRSQNVPGASAGAKAAADAG